MSSINTPASKIATSRRFQLFFGWLETYVSSRSSA
jgi:hypothetical protein